MYNVSSRACRIRSVPCPSPVCCSSHRRLRPSTPSALFCSLPLYICAPSLLCRPFRFRSRSRCRQPVQDIPTCFGPDSQHSWPLLRTSFLARLSSSHTRRPTERRSRELFGMPKRPSTSRRPLVLSVLHWVSLVSGVTAHKSLHLKLA